MQQTTDQAALGAPRVKLPRSFHAFARRKSLGDAHMACQNLNFLAGYRQTKKYEHSLQHERRHPVVSPSTVYSRTQQATRVNWAVGAELVRCTLCSGHDKQVVCCVEPFFEPSVSIVTPNIQEISCLLYQFRF